MAKKEETLCAGKITVKFQDKYEIYEKPLPSGMDPGINWLCNFGFKETGKKLKGKLPGKYEVFVPYVENKVLVYWDGSKAVDIPNQSNVKIKDKIFRKGELDLADPPVGDR